MKTLWLTIVIMGGTLAIACVIWLITTFLRWLSGGELWGLALALAVVSAPFAYSIARHLRK